MQLASDVAALLLRLDVLLAMCAGGAFGLFVGAMPGLTATMALALLVPVTFYLDPVPALALMVSASSMAIFAGDLPGALLRIPGTPASAAYCDDTFALTNEGRAHVGLGVGLGASVAGGLIGSTVLALSAPALARVALGFSSYEYFWLACLGLSCAALVSQSTPLRGLISLLIGLLIATVGLDSTTGYPRFTFGFTETLGGIPFIPTMIGMFALAEIAHSVLTGTAKAMPAQARAGRIWGSVGRALRRPRSVARGSALGTLVGALPGAGADIAAWIAYAISKRFSREPERFGHGSEEGVADASAANSASIAGGWIPTLVFGIPGDSGAAIVIGVLYLKDLAPGPTLFLYQPELLYAVFATFFLANLLLLLFGSVMIALARYVLAVPFAILAPVIVLFCTVGAFAMNNTVFGVAVMVGAGLLALAMRASAIPIAPAILGLVLGPLLEKSFLTSMVKANGDPLEFISRPIAGGLAALTIAVWIAMLVVGLRARERPVHRTGDGVEPDTGR